MSDQTFTQTFYTLPVEDVRRGMSTADGQDVLRTSTDNDHTGRTLVSLEVYTPRSDNPELDAQNRCEPEWRIYSLGERVHLAVFVDTDNDGSDYDHAVITGTVDAHVEI
ncbi:hypothetical protein [Nocardia farcinica]|uniref:hypothetical protein n=2 Tax=Nocardia farcinica TaxID=37329 RepID=UPI00245416A0|nr:hypothetical protein [Nocardia farcinica]